MKVSPNSKIVGGCVLGLTLIVILFICISAGMKGRALPSDVDEDGSAAVITTNKLVKANASVKRPVRQAGRKPIRLEDRKDIGVAEKRLLKSIGSASDGDDLNALLKLKDEVLKSANVEVRSEFVDALGWFGKESLSDLLVFVNDADEDVSSLAVYHCTQGLQQIENPKKRFEIAASFFGALGNGDQLSSLGGILSSSAMEFIDSAANEDVKNGNRVKVIQRIVDIMETCPKQNSEAAKELYKDITGHEWRGIDEAEKYLNDPENYDSES